MGYLFKSAFLNQVSNLDKYSHKCRIYSLRFILSNEINISLLFDLFLYRLCHRKKVLDSNPQAIWSLHMWSVCMLFLCLYVFLMGFIQQGVELTGHFKLAVGVCMLSCLSVLAL